jgi:hypothetical protein
MPLSIGDELEDIHRRTHRMQKENTPRREKEKRNHPPDSFLGSSEQGSKPGGFSGVAYYWIDSGSATGRTLLPMFERIKCYCFRFKRLYCWSVRQTTVLESASNTHGLAILCALLAVSRIV